MKSIRWWKASGSKETCSGKKTRWAKWPPKGNVRITHTRPFCQRSICRNWVDLRLQGISPQTCQAAWEIVWDGLSKDRKIEKLSPAPEVVSTCICCSLQTKTIRKRHIFQHVLPPGTVYRLLSFSTGKAFYIQEYKKAQCKQISELCSSSSPNSKRVF